MCSLRDFSRALYPLAVRRRAPRWIIFLALAVTELRGQDRRRPLAPGGSRAPKIASALNLHPKGPALITFVHYARARGGAERRRRPIFFLRIRLAAQQECSAAAPSAASYGVDVAAGGLHRQADGSRPCARSEISAVPFIRWRYGAARRAGLLFGLGRQRATGSGSPPAARTRRVSRSENRECIESHPKGPALITFVHYARARGGAEPAAGRFSFCESGWRRSRSVRRRRRAQRATGSTSPPAACTGKLMGLGRVLAPRFQPCPLSVGGTAPRAALDYFLALAGDPGATGSGSPPAARTRRVSRSENRECIESHPKGPALITFVHYARARGGAEPAAGRFSFCESGWRRSRSVRRRRRAQRATGSTSPPAACTGKLMGLGRVLAPRFQPCPLSVGGTAPRAALDYFLALAGQP